MHCIPFPLPPSSCGGDAHPCPLPPPPFPFPLLPYLFIAVDSLLANEFLGRLVFMLIFLLCASSLKPEAAPPRSYACSTVCPLLVPHVEAHGPRATSLVRFLGRFSPTFSTHSLAETLKSTQPLQSAKVLRDFNAILKEFLPGESSDVSPFWCSS